MVLNASDILRAWEAGQGQHPLDRALTLLQAAEPGAARQDLALLPIGERDARLLALREATLGGTLNGYAECPACAERLEFDIGTETLRLPYGGSKDYALANGDWTIVYRLPNSLDLAAVTGCSDARAAKRCLAERCIRSAADSGEAVEAGSLPERALEVLSEAMAAADPQADVSLDLCCPACDQAWRVPFDIGAFFWAEVSVQAKRILRDVALLARAYGWREADVLALTAFRRRVYVEMAGG